MWTDGRTDGRTDRQTERHDEANSRFSQFFKTPEKCGTELWEHSVNPISLTNSKFCTTL